MFHSCICLTVAIAKPKGMDLERDTLYLRLLKHSAGDSGIDLRGTVMLVMGIDTFRTETWSVDMETVRFEH